MTFTTLLTKNDFASISHWHSMYLALSRIFTDVAWINYNFWKVTFNQPWIREKNLGIWLSKWYVVVDLDRKVIDLDHLTRHSGPARQWDIHEQDAWPPDHKAINT